MTILILPSIATLVRSAKISVGVPEEVGLSDFIYYPAFQELALVGRPKFICHVVYWVHQVRK